MYLISQLNSIGILFKENQIRKRKQFELLDEKKIAN